MKCTRSNWPFSQGSCRKSFLGFDRNRVLIIIECEFHSRIENLERVDSLQDVKIASLVAQAVEPLHIVFNDFNHHKPYSLLGSHEGNLALRIEVCFPDGQITSIPPSYGEKIAYVT